MGYEFRVQTMQKFRRAASRKSILSTECSMGSGTAHNDLSLTRPGLERQTKFRKRKKSNSSFVNALGHFFTRGVTRGVDNIARKVLDKTHSTSGDSADSKPRHSCGW